MKKTLSIAAVALLVAGSTAFACGGNCGSKKSDKETASYKSEQSQFACGGSKKGEKNQTACGGSKKGDDSKQTV